MNEDLAGVLAIITIVLCVSVFVGGIGITIYSITIKHEVKVFNEFYETDYTFAEWFWTSQSIKDYHLGEVENRNYQIDLNVERGEAG